MSILTNYLIREIDEAQQKSMEALFRGWEQEIEAHQKALEEAHRKAMEQQAQDAALSASIAVYIQGLYEQAQGGRDVSGSVPTDIRVASTTIAGPSMAELNALISASGTVDDAVVDQAQRSAAWAVSHSMVPHPGDLGAILTRVGVDEAWAERFNELGAKLDQLGDAHFKNPQLQVHIGAQRLHAVGETVRLLNEYTPDRTLRLVGNPTSLLDLPGKVGAPSASAQSPGAKMGASRFNKMLDGLFS